MIIPGNSCILEILHFTLKNEKYNFTFKGLNDPIKPTTIGISLEKKKN